MTDPIMTEEDRTCCFTGHRAIPLHEMTELYRLLDETILSLYHKGVRSFRAGGAIGFDTVAALRVLYLKSQGYDLRLVLMLPCRNQTDRWPRSAVLDYEFILRSADEVIYVSETYTPYCMHARDRALVDGSRYCISYLKENRGGTAYTVAYALKNRLSLINLGEHFL